MGIVPPTIGRRKGNRGIAMDEMIEKMAEWLLKFWNDSEESHGDLNYMARQLLQAIGINPDLLTENTRLAVVEKEGKLPNKYDELNTEISMIYNMGYMNAQQDMLKDHWVKEVKDG